MESAIIVSFNRDRFYGFAKVILINGKKITTKNEEIFFHLDCGYKMKIGKKKPKFNFKVKLKKSPKLGDTIIFVRKKSNKENHLDKAAVWSFRSQYKKIWKRLDEKNSQQKKLLKINQLFNEIGANRKAL